MAQSIIISCFFALFFIFNGVSVNAQAEHTATLSTTWNNTNPLEYFGPYPKILPILFATSFACGFYCNGPCTSYLFAVFALEPAALPQVVWSANRDSPVSIGAMLNFTATGDLALQDVDGSTVWTTSTSGKSVSGMNLTDSGNLVLYDVNGSVVWQSFDYPTDTLLPGQRLLPGQQLIPSVSDTDWTAQKGLYSFQLTDQGVRAFVGSNQPQVYYKKSPIQINYTSKEMKYFRFLNGSLSFLLADPSTFQFMKFMPDGHLKVFERQLGAWSEAADLLTDEGYGECTYPLACGRNAICSYNQQCSCPKTDYFRVVNDRKPNQGCSEITPLTCNATQDHVFIELKKVSLYTNSPTDLEDVTLETCKKACLDDCSCKAAVFKPGPESDSLYGKCSLPSELFTMISVDKDRFGIRTTSLTFIKVQNVKSTPPATPKKKSRRPIAVLIASIIGGSSVLVLLVAVVVITFFSHKRRSDAQRDEECIDVVRGLPTRFTYEDLKTATENFSKKLGQGGFGSVFEGTLKDGSKIAVKRLDGRGHGNKSFLAEVESIGRIHHVNLVRMRGFCAWKSQRFLVYDFMTNGSLSRWIYHGNREHILEWQCRKKIIIDIAKGLAYLHEECVQKIIHLDIKPQNILLDKDFNAKVADFGLSKLIDRNQSQVMTRMRGTPGYMAPEWLSSVITEKVDVYSFGVVMLEILCGRKKFDISEPEESQNLLQVFQSCWEQGTVLEMADKYSADMQTHSSEVMDMMELASWCLQTNHRRRPSMSSVVMVLEGGMDVESDLDYNFIDPRLQNTAVRDQNGMTQLTPCVLSGPR